MTFVELAKAGEYRPAHAATLVLERRGARHAIWPVIGLRATPARAGRRGGRPTTFSSPPLSWPTFLLPRLELKHSLRQVQILRRLLRFRSLEIRVHQRDLAQ